MIYHAPWSSRFSGFCSAPPGLSSPQPPLSSSLKNLDLRGHGGLPVYSASPQCQHPCACSGRAKAGQIEDTCALRPERSGAAPALFLGQQVQLGTDIKIHSQGEGRRAKQEQGSALPPRTWLPPEDTFAVRTPRVLILSPGRCKHGQHFRRGQGPPPSPGRLPEGSRKSRRKRHSLDTTLPGTPWVP